MWTRIGRFILPPDIAVRKRRLELMIWAFLLSLAYYPGPFGVLAWVALVRPLMIISRQQGKDVLRASYFFGFFFALFGLYWVAQVTPPGMIAAVVILGFYYAFVFMTFYVIYRWKAWLGMALFPFLWVGMEYFRTLSQFAFPWSDIGYTQSYFLYILQIVSVISVHGLSLLIVAVNVLLWQIFRPSVSPPKKLTSGLVSMAVVVGLIAHGWAIMPLVPAPGKYQIVLLQGSVPLDIKWELESEGYSIHLYDSLAQSVKDSNPKLAVWPESAAPCYVSTDINCRRLVGAISKRTGMYHLVGGLGAATSASSRSYYNACYQFSPEGHLDASYNKMKLVPFAEQVPYQDRVPFLKRDFLTEYLTIIETMDVQWWSDFHPGDSLHLFHLPDATYGVLICFESTFPEFARAMVRQGANFILGITNDTWFGTSVGIHMHSRMFVTRAVENRCWMGRAANSGLTYIVDGYGRIRQSLPVYTVEALTGKVGFVGERTIFTEYGDIAGFSSFLVTAGILAIFIVLWIYQRFFARSSSASSSASSR